MEEHSLQDKIAKSHKIVGAAVAAATLTGGVPIPFADMIPLIGEQIAMLGSVTAVFGFHLRKSALKSLVYSAISVSGAAFGGRALVSAVLKAIPGAGTGAGILVSAGAAGTLTLIIGEAYIQLMTSAAQNGGDLPPLDVLKREFISLVKAERSKARTDKEAESLSPADPEAQAGSPPLTDTETDASATPTDDESPWIIRFEE